MAGRSKEATIKAINDILEKMMDDVFSGVVKKLDTDSYNAYRKHAERLSREGEFATKQQAYSAEQADKAADVQANIRQRAKLRERKALQFPNIASIMTGGAPGPVSMLGKYQQQISKPFQAVSQYKEAERDRKAFEYEEAQRKDADPDYKPDRKRAKIGRDLRSEEEGAKERAGIGFGKRLMGKRMQGLIGKVGKFMESGKGQGALAGLMGVASIATMIIKKAMEASPMLQAMLKIMNVAMTLFLRPIGDFIGGMLKPITLFFLREVAIPMLRSGKGMIKMGEEVGKGILGFVLNPIEVIKAGLFAWSADALKNTFLDSPELQELGQFAKLYDPIKHWMSEKKTETLSAQLSAFITKDPDFGGRSGPDVISKGVFLSLFDPITGLLQPLEDLPDLQQQLLQTLQGLGGDEKGLWDMMQSLVKDTKQNVYDTVDAIAAQSAIGGGVADYMGEGALGKQLSILPPVLNTITKSGNDVVASFTNMNQAANWLALQYRLKAMQGTLTPEMQAATKELFDQFKKSMIPAHLEEYFPSPNWAEFEAALDAILNPVVEAEAELEEQLEGIGEGTDTIDSIMAQLVGDWIANRASSAQMTTDFEGMASLTLAGYLKVQESMAKLNALGYSLTTRNIQRDAAGNITTPNILQWGGSAGKEYRLNLSKEAVDFYKGKIDEGANLTIKQGQHGGMINEKIWGMGESGQRYTFGEAGPELVTPLTGGKNTLGNITANITINIDKVLHDIDLEQIKPIVERALLEVHSRRGII